MHCIFLATLTAAGSAQLTKADDDKEGKALVIEELPEEVIASIEVRDRYFTNLQSGNAGEEFFVSELQRWRPGQTVRVAFLEGDISLRTDIQKATKCITDACNIKLDFGYDTGKKNFRTWSTKDLDYTAEIRVSFDQKGYFSLFGTDSIGRVIGNESEPVGGRPNQRTLNLGGFDFQRPAGWQGVVRHEFLHALGFHHEHQSLASPCDEEFRWEDDPGYRPTTDVRGMYVAYNKDGKELRPGIYTYLAGFPNRWARPKVDHNLRRYPTSTNVKAGDFDRKSIMLYRFPPLFYRRVPSPCAPIGDGIDLSQGDIDGLRQLYPREPERLKSYVEKRQRLSIALIERGLKEPPIFHGKATLRRRVEYDEATLELLGRVLSAK
jgi:hypothetical protein